MEWGRSSHFSLLLQIQSPKAHPLLLKKPCCSPTPCLVDPTDVPLLTDHSLHYPRPQLQQDSLGTHRLLWPGKQISYLQILTTPSTLPRSITHHPWVCRIPHLHRGLSSISTPRRRTKQISVEHRAFLPLVKPLHPTPSPFPFLSLRP